MTPGATLDKTSPARSVVAGTSESHPYAKEDEMFWHWTSDHDPFRELRSLHRRMDEVFGVLHPEGRSMRRQEPNAPAINVYDNGETLLVEAELPGLSQTDVNIEATENTLTISGARKVIAPEGYTAHRRERAAYEFARSFELPSKIDLERVSATMTHGVLTITLTKQAEARPRQISIKAA
jgi:HSP20 family protein